MVKAVDFSCHAVQVTLVGGGYQGEGGRYTERVKEGEYGGTIVYSYMKMEQGNLLKLC
jgi:hypothetical protein